VLGVGDDLDDGEERLPHRRVADREIAPADARAPRGAVADERARGEARVERPVASSPDEQPVLADYSRSTTPAMAWPKPMHIAAMP
jgi:hypothetical protein